MYVMNENKIIEVNELLSSGKSLNQLDKSGVLECSRKAFKNRALKLNYIYNADIKQFVKSDDTNSVTTNVTKSNTHITPKKNKNLLIKSEYKDLFLKELEDRVKLLESIVLHNNTKVTPNNDFEIEIKKDIITRSIKVSKEIINNFNSLAETKLSMYNKQDLLNKALKEFVEKYK